VTLKPSSRWLRIGVIDVTKVRETKTLLAATFGRGVSVDSDATAFGAGVHPESYASQEFYEFVTKGRPQLIEQPKASEPLESGA